jgi:hypothetical protein
LFVAKCYRGDENVMKKASIALGTEQKFIGNFGRIA